MFKGKLRAQINVIWQRSKTHNIEISGIIHNNRIIRTVKGGRTDVCLPYDKAFDIYFHTHLVEVLGDEDICPYHFAALPSAIDLVAHVYTSRAHITEYIFTQIGYYKMTNPNNNTLDERVLDALRLYYTMLVGMFYLRDNCDEGILNDIQFFMQCVNTVDLSLLPSNNSHEGKALYLYVKSYYSSVYTNSELMHVLRGLEKKKFAKLEFFGWP